MSETCLLLIIKENVTSPGPDTGQSLTNAVTGDRRTKRFSSGPLFGVFVLAISFSELVLKKRVQNIAL